MGTDVAIDLPPKPSGEVWLIDCFHETIGEPGCNTIIALSFSEFLERALARGGRHYSARRVFVRRRRLRSLSRIDGRAPIAGNERNNRNWGRRDDRSTRQEVRGSERASLRS